MKAGSKTPPANVLKVGVQAGRMPHIASHRRQQSRAVGQKIVIADEEERFPGVLEWQIDCIDGVRLIWAEFAARFELVRPLGRAALISKTQRILCGRSDEPLELAILDPRRIEHFDIAEAIGKDDAPPGAVEAVINERLRWLLLLGSRQALADWTEAI